MKLWMMKTVVLGWLTAALLAACAIGPREPRPPLMTVQPRAETAPVVSTDDAADDPAIWINPANPAASRVLGTDKGFGVEVYDLQGNKLQSIAAGRTNNIDLRPLPEGGAYVALAAASNRSTNTISLFGIAGDGTVTWQQGQDIVTGLTEPYGLCMYQDAAGLQVFVNDTDGRYQQWLLRSQGAGGTGFTADRVREFRVASQPEGCVADDRHQRLFVGEEGAGVWVVDARYSAPAELQLLAPVDRRILTADVEGMSLYEAGDSGYLVVSSQGSHSYAVFDRLPPFAFRGHFRVVDDPANGLDGSQETDGLAVVSAPLGPDYPRGLLVVQDGSNTAPRDLQNFKYISWADVATALGLN
jgi:3-phytase